jgi:tetraacyldisaccharide 4'-kinase
MPWYAFLLAPFALIFRIVTGIRNFLYDHGFFKSSRAPIPTLVVGNISVGGTGKTPMVEFLIRHLIGDVSLACLSRGYGRQTKGFLKASLDSNASDIGDEPLQIFQKFGGKVPVFVGEDRLAALKKMAVDSPGFQLAVLDDAFQHRRLKGDVYMLLTPFSKPFFQDFIMPVGRLRESRSGAKRADLVVVTKCPEGISSASKAEIRRGLNRYLDRNVPVFFSKIAYGPVYPVGHTHPFSGTVILLSGLADERLFVSYCREKFIVLDELAFPDHHDYGNTELEKIASLAKKHSAQSPVLLTTEKDAVKLNSFANQGFLGEIPIFALPVEARFEPDDMQMLLSYIREKFRKK